MRRSKFFEKAMLLTLSNIVTGILSFIFSVILSRSIGSRGLGLYQLVMPLYMFFLVFTGGGITITISKIAAEKKALYKLSELYKTVYVMIIFEFFWSLIVTIFIVLSAGFLSKYLLSDRRTFFSILAFCPAVVIISISSVFKGAFYGLQNVMVPALIDVFEKASKILLVYILVRLTSNLGVEYLSAAAVLSLSIGELFSLILFYICYKIYKNKNPSYGKCDNSLQLIFNVLMLALPLALNGILSTSFGTLTTVLIPRRLQAAGISYENALSLLGKLQGMAMTIIFFPSIIIGSLNTLIIPSISEAVTFKKNSIINHRINIAIKATSVVAFSSAALMLAVPEKLGIFFFKDPYVGELIKILAPTIPIVYIESISFALLNGLGKQKNILINSTILSVFDLVLIYVFLGIPSLNIKGYAFDFALSGTLGLILNFRTIKRSLDYYMNPLEEVFIPFLVSIFTYIITAFFLCRLKYAPLLIALSYFIFLFIYFPSYKFLQTKKSST